MRKERERKLEEEEAIDKKIGIIERMNYHGEKNTRKKIVEKEMNGRELRRNRCSFKVGRPQEKYRRDLKT